MDASKSFMLGAPHEVTERLFVVRRAFRVNDSLPADPHDWKKHAQLVEATWWQDWTGWIAERGGEMVLAPDSLGNDDYPPIEKAPGSYVLATA